MVCVINVPFSRESTYLTELRGKRKQYHLCFIYHRQLAKSRTVPECAPPPTKSQKEATETKIHYKVGHGVPNALEYSEKWLEKDIALLLSEGKHCEPWEERGDKNQPPAISKSLRSGPQQGEMQLIQQIFIKGLEC